MRLGNVPEIVTFDDNISFPEQLISPCKAGQSISDCSAQSLHNRQQIAPRGHAMARRDCMRASSGLAQKPRGHQPSVGELQCSAHVHHRRGATRPRGNTLAAPRHRWSARARARPRAAAKEAGSLRGAAGSRKEILDDSRDDDHARSDDQTCADNSHPVIVCGRHTHPAGARGQVRAMALPAVWGVISMMNFTSTAT